MGLGTGLCEYTNHTGEGGLSSSLLATVVQTGTGNNENFVLGEALYVYRKVLNT